MAKDRDILGYRNHYVRDWWMSSTVRMMGYAAQGIYHALLDQQWEDGHIPADAERCQRLLRCTPEEWASFSEFLDECFPVGEDGLRRNPRNHAERIKAEELIAKAQESGRLSGEARRKNKGKRTKAEQSMSEALAPVEPESNDCRTDDERSLNGRSAVDEQSLNTTTTTYSLAEASDANDELPNDADDPESEVIEAEVISGNPFPTVQRVLQALSKAMNQPPPTDPMVRRYIGRSSSILRLVDFCGEDLATKLLIWCARWKTDLGYAAVFSNVQQLLAEAEKARWGQPGSAQKGGWGDPAADVERMVDESRWEEDERLMREAF